MEFLGILLIFYIVTNMIKNEIMNFYKKKIVFLKEVFLGNFSKQFWAIFKMF